MSFIKKLFDWAKPNHIRETDIKFPTAPDIYLRYEFPRRDIYNPSNFKKKNYRMQSSSTNDSIETHDLPKKYEINDPPAWNKKSSKSYIETHMQKKQEKQTNDEPKNEAAIKIEINYIEKPKKFRMNQEVDLTGVEDFVTKSNSSKQFTGFKFNRDDKNISKKEKQDILVSKEEKNNKSDFISPKDDKDNTENKPALSKSSSESDNNVNNSIKIDPYLSLPKPRGRFIFDTPGKNI